MPVEAELLGILVPIVIGIGGVVLQMYRWSSALMVVLHGENGDEGFIESSRRTQQELAEQQREIQTQLQVQGRLLNEIAYSVADLSEDLEELEECGVDVDTDRLEDLQERANDSRWRDDSGD